MSLLGDNSGRRGGAIEALAQVDHVVASRACPQCFFSVKLVRQSYSRAMA